MRKQSHDRAGIDAEPVEPRHSDPLDDHVDALPDDLNVVDHIRAYDFPDNSRRRIPAMIYLGVAALLVALVIARGTSAVLVNGGFLLAAGVLAATAVMSYTSGWRMHVDERQALVAAQGAVGFAVGEPPGQPGGGGGRSRPPGGGRRY